MGLLVFNDMQTPSSQHLPKREARVARAVAEGLASVGQRGWMVGGTVRDLARGAAPKDVDMATAATPEQVEAAFPHTISVGRAFGTVLVIQDGLEVQVTTFRSESGYSDARRPDVVTYGSSAEEDASRRDFTCNAIFLDPLNDEVLDPENGLADLKAGVLRCVGDPERRFREDGLRLLRMARFEAGLGLLPAEGLHAAARGAGEALRGVSPERVYHELSRMLCGPDSRRAIGILVECGLLERVLPGGAGAADDAALLALDLLDQPIGLARGMALLCDPNPGASYDEALAADGKARLQELRASRVLMERVREQWRLRREALLASAEGVPISRRIRAVRSPEWLEALSLARAWRVVDGGSTQALDALAEWAAGLEEHQLSPEPMLSASDLESSGIERGRRWGELLEEAESRQLDGELTDRDAALAWLAEQS